jgi:dinuclear metal center YbgI/SA1388 family protein
MAPKLQDILNLLDEIAPFSKAEEWDNPGFQVGSFSREIKRILVALDPTLKAVKQASDNEAQLLLTHHPIFFGNISSLDIDKYPGDVINEALAKGVSIVAVHTNLDAARGGINDILADIFGLQGVEALQNRDGIEGGVTGMGRIGYLPASMELSAVSEAIKNALGAPALRVRGPEDMKIRKVAVVGGSGGSMVSLASEMGADLLVTGDIKHHEAMVAESLGVALIDGGHFWTEKAALNVFINRLRDKVKLNNWDIILDNYEGEEEPMRYFYSPSPEYPAACRRDEWRGEPRRSSKSEGG